jgi:quercetin dioxygenase-like cupin family protein
VKILKILFSMPLALVILVSACGRSTVGQLDFPEGTQQLAVHSDDIAWGPCPKNAPPGCELAVLEGSPQTDGLFTVRIRVGDDFAMPPHTHPREERVTVLKGRMAVVFGVNGMREDASRFGPGDYYVNARDAVHSVWADEPSEIQITGIGPWEVHLVEPDDRENP